MKVVICRNRHFNFSDKAFEILIEKGWTVTESDENGKYNDPEAQISKRSKLLFGKFEFNLFPNVKFDNYDFVDIGGVRTNPDVIQIVEELGKEANGYFSDLKIVEIPDDVKWFIDGDEDSEWIAEEHRTWGMKWEEDDEENGVNE